MATLTVGSPVPSNPTPSCLGRVRAYLKALVAKIKALFSSKAPVMPQPTAPRQVSVVTGPDDPTRSCYHAAVAAVQQAKDAYDRESAEKDVSLEEFIERLS